MLRDPDVLIGFVPPGGNDVWIKPIVPPPPSAGTSAAERKHIRELAAMRWDRAIGVKWYPPHNTDPLDRIDRGSIEKTK